MLNVIKVNVSRNSGSLLLARASEVSLSNATGHDWDLGGWLRLCGLAGRIGRMGAVGNDVVAYEKCRKEIPIT